MSGKPKIAVTMGDPAGVGPEICLQLLRHAETAEICEPIIYGSVEILQRVSAATGIPFEKATGAVRDFPMSDAATIEPGRVDARCGEAAYHYVISAIDAGLAGEIDAVTTAPLNKEALHAAGHHYPGHTEIFAERMHAERSCMMLTSDELTCSFVTVHVGYHEVPGLLSVERILEVIELTVAAMRRIRGREPKLLICGLNPHAGEHGLFGQREEERIVEPAVAAARAAGIAIEGPLPPDTVFLPWRRAAYDAVVCLYHDQGHIPLKALAFDTAINTTLGLPVVRTSVDHGTAFDIAWQGKASPNSLFEAVKLAAKLSR
jgi:4-hydroxythreonine-4-phosphate dehydrogenase